MLPVLRNHNFAFLWIGGLISTLGDWVLRGALPFYVYAKTGSALAAGLAFVASAFPWILLSSVAGVFVDSWDRKRTMIIADVSRSFLILLLLLTVYVRELFWLVYLVSFVEACITQFFNPASLALTPAIVGKEQLQQANSLNSLSSSVSRLVGPLLGGLLLGLFGIGSTVIADSISYIGSAVLISIILVPSLTVEPQNTPTKTNAAEKWLGYWHNWLEGLNVVKEERMITVLFLVVALSALADGVINPLFVVFPAAVLHLGPLYYGEILTAIGVGSIVGSVLIGWLARIIPSTRFLWLGLLGKGVVYLLAFNFRLFPVIFALFVLSGTPTVASQVSTQTILQTDVEEHLRGRVFGAYVTTISLLLLLGTAIGGGLAAPLGIMPILDIGCSLFILAGIVALVLFKMFLIPKQGVTTGDTLEEIQSIKE